MYVFLQLLCHKLDHKPNKSLSLLTLFPVIASLQIIAYGRLLQGHDDNEPISTFCKTGDDLIVLPRRKVSPSDTVGERASRQTHPPVSLAQVNAAIKEENERLAAAGEPPPPIANSPPTTAAASAAAGAAAGDRLEGSIRALVEGNFEQLRGYLEQLQEAVARQGIGGDEIMFGMPGDEEDDDDDDGMGEGDDEDLEEDEEGNTAVRNVAAVAEALVGGMGGGQPVQIPQVEEAALAELLLMGFPDQLSRNALLLHRNRLQPAVDWALSHIDDPQGNEPLTEDVLAAVYGPQRRLGGGGGDGGRGAFRMARRPRLPPGQVDPGTLDSMVEMGFDRDQSARALAFTGNRLEDACQLIINGLPLPPLPEQQPQEPNPAAGGAEGGEAAALGGGEGEEGGHGSVVDAALAGAVQAAMAPGAGEQGQGDRGGMMDHDDSHEDEEDEDWESDGDEDLDLEGADIDHAMDLMFGGLGDGGAHGVLPGGAVDWMAEEDWHSEDDDDDDGDYSEEENEDEDAFDVEEGFHGAGYAMNEGEGGGVPPASGAGEPPAAPPAQGAPPPESQSQQPSSGNGGDTGEK